MGTTTEATPNGHPDKTVVASDRSKYVQGNVDDAVWRARACLERIHTQSAYISVLATVLREYRIVPGGGPDAKLVKQETDNPAAGTATLAPVLSVELALKKQTDVGTG
ncbi:uncharacterized protein CC84DRAFT_1241957 [Paraphaeosphaeria sporulosa]|uniref:Uncharacterized protein n=1 Tax=Paraphaeosphaeria sporulosa TaxID=1460663 RepID=A0A177CHE3_9PLEO|nr:uncharacterized protein CC84DRAFT_1241957 [Paraphaeosphaeria sporulosa]OAG07003.1 hypothetical protein CC84DRAFT_1241957 [Paraphaeosphaeria sporulosa]